MTNPINFQKNDLIFNPRIGAGRDLEDLAIETERLTLKPVSHEFAEVMYREFTPEITRYMVPKSPDHIDETRAFISEAIAQRQRLSDLVFVILSRGTHDFLGVCGLHARKDPREPEFGIWLAKSAHGSGYGREAIRAVKDWAEKNLDLQGFIYPVDKANIASRKIPESMGGVVVKEVMAPTMSGGFLDEVIYRIPVEVRR